MLPLELLLGGHASSKQNQNRKVLLESPVVGKFQENIYYDQYYNQSAVADYVAAFYAGYQMQDYAFADECLQYTTATLDQLYEFNLNMTRRYNWNEPFFLITDTVGGPFNDAWFYCYQYYDDFKLVYLTKFENFVDFGDLYLSFIFNLLGNSLQLKQQTERMILANERHDTVLYFQSLGAIMRMMLDFNSYKTAGSSFMSYAVDAAKRDLGLQGVPSKSDRILAKDQRSAEARFNLRQSKIEDKPLLKRGSGYSWGLWDLLQAPFALTTGALGALPLASFGYECSLNVQSARQYLLESRDFFGDEESLEGYTAMHDSISFTGNIGLLCYYAFAEDLSVQHFEDTFADPVQILINLAYNLGAIWVDLQNWLFFTPETVPQGDWGYFVMYLFGNAVMSFFYRDESAATV